MTTAPTTTPLVLRASGDGEGKPLPLGLEGYPTEADGVPIHYRRAKLATCAEWRHRGTGEPVSITRDRVDAWVRNTRALRAAGVQPFIPNRHTAEFSAADNNGYVIDISREGDDLYAVLALYGDDARKRAAVNGRSIYVVSNARDASGKVHEGESIAHVALVPNPALPDLGPTVKIAASASGAAMEVPVLELDCGRWRDIDGHPVCVDGSENPSGGRSVSGKLFDLAKRSPGKPVAVRVRVNGEEKTIRVKTDSRGAAMGVDTGDGKFRMIEAENIDQAGWKIVGEGNANGRGDNLSTRTPTERAADVEYLSKKPLADLRRRQDLLQQQIAKAHEMYVNHPASREMADRAMTNLREREADLTEAVSRKGEGRTGRTYSSQDKTRAERAADAKAERPAADAIAAKANAEFDATQRAQSRDAAFKRMKEAEAVNTAGDKAAHAEWSKRVDEFRTANAATEIDRVSVSPARYAKGKMAVRIPGEGGFKTRAAYLAEGLGGKYSGRDNAYIMSPGQAERLKRMVVEGWDYSNIVHEFTSPAGEKIPRGDKRILRLSGDTPMTEQQLDSIGEFIGADDITDETAVDRLLEFAKQQKAKAETVTALSADVAKLTKERDDAAAKVLSLNASAPKQPDAVTLAMYQDNISAKREAAIKSGALSEAEAKGFDAILADANGVPTPLALSASSGNRPLAFAVWDALGKLGTNGVRTGHALPRTGGDSALRLSGDSDADAEKVRADAKAEVKRWQDEQLRARGLQPIA